MDDLSETDLGQLDAVVRLFRRVLGDAAIGAYLYGSAVTSGLRRDSDLDILVISSRRTTNWALARVPQGRGDALRRARAGYLGEAADPWDGDAMVEARVDAALMCTVIDGLRSGAG